MIWKDFIKGSYALKKGALATSLRTLTCGDGTVIKSSTSVRYEPDRNLDLLNVFLGASPEPVNVLHRVSRRAKK